MGGAETVGWVATGLTIVAASLVALDLGRRITGFAFIVFSLGSAAWVVAAHLDGDGPLGTTNLALLAINLIGVWRWLVRKAPGAKRVQA